MRTDYHLHCEFSDDSRETMDSQIKRAIELGLDEICFTDHVDYGIKKDWDEGDILWRGGDGIGTSVDQMDPCANVNYPEYFSKIDRMRETYKGRITIKKGLKKGTYKLKIDITAAGNANYLAATKQVVVTIKVK